jgi:hypothetical protein
VVWLLRYHASLGRTSRRGREAGRGAFVCGAGAWPSLADVSGAVSLAPPATAVVAGWFWWRRPLIRHESCSGVSLRRLTAAGFVIPSGLKGVGHHSRCFTRRACFAAANGAAAVDGNLVGSGYDAPGSDLVLFVDLGSFLDFCWASL